jgi:glycosyltransferase involved in cell wall biosynthesis
LRTVVFDGACLGDGPITGVGRAFVNALGAYAEFESRCVLLLPGDAARPQLPKVELVPAPRGALRRQLALPRLLRELHADVLHSPVAAVPLWADCPTIATVHDLPWLHPELQERTTLWRRSVTKRALRSAAAIVTPSAFTARDVATLLRGGAPPAHVIAHGTELGPQPRPGATAQRSGPLLVLGDDRPRKNRDRVRQAHAIARQGCPRLPDLCFVGPPHDYVDEATKLQLLESCRAVVQCSLFEGFGMPVLEALANGAPVLCADIAPFREITADGECALLVDPKSVEAIARGMVRIHEDEHLREHLARSGWQRASHFRRIGVAEQWHRLHTGLAQ